MINKRREKITAQVNKSDYYTHYQTVCAYCGQKFDDKRLPNVDAHWPAPGSADTELGVLMEPEVRHGKAEVYTRVQA